MNEQGGWIPTREGVSQSFWTEGGWSVVCMRTAPQKWRAEVSHMDHPIEAHTLEARDEDEARSLALEILRRARGSQPESDARGRVPGA